MMGVYTESILKTDPLSNREKGWGCFFYSLTPFKALGIMKKILGLDLGTNSIGWAVVERFNEIVDKNGVRHLEEHFDLKEKGVLIFSEGVKIEKGNESSKAGERTGNRSARRIKFRRKLRKYETLKVLIENGMCPLSLDELNVWKSSINPENGKKWSFKKYPTSDAFRQWLHTDNEGDKEERKKQQKNPYFLRAKALDEKLTKEELGRVFYHFAQRRGFLSNRLETTDASILESALPSFQKTLDISDPLDILKEDLNSMYVEYDVDEEENKDIKKLKRSFDGIIKHNSDLSLSDLKEKLDKRLNRKESLGAVKQGISELAEKITDGGYRTMGEYFYSCYKDGTKIRKQYTAREDHYLEEFKTICKTQKLNADLENKLYRAIFFQRPLKSQKGTVGTCSFEKNKARCPVSHFDFEEFRMYSFLNNIKIKRPGDEKLDFLNEDEREKAKAKFYRRPQNFKFEDIAKALAPKNDYAFYKGKNAKDVGYLFNYQMTTTVAGCPTTALLKSVFEKELIDISIEYKTKNRKGETVERTVDANDLWHILFSYDSFDKLYEFASEKLQLDDRKASTFARARLKKDYAALSLKAIRNILPYLRAGLIYSHAVFMAKLPEIIDRDKWASDKDFISGAIKSVIDNDREDNKRVGIVNDLMHAFKIEYNNHHSDYELDEMDRKAVNEKVLQAYGKKGFELMETDKQNKLITDLENRYVNCLRSNEFIKKKRLDEKVLELIESRKLCSDSSRLEKLYHPSDIDVYKKQSRAEDGKIYLGSPRTNSVRNPMAMRALYQLSHLINTLIKEDTIDENTIIQIELARELNDSNKRKAIQTWQKGLEKQKETYAKEIIRLYEDACGKVIAPNDMDVLKYKFWEEQNRVCPYTGKPISICDFIGPSPNFDIEHTLPRSLSEDNSDMNRTLCDMNYNREVKKNRIPYELKQDYAAILLRIEHWKKDYEALEKQMEAETRRVKASTTKEAKDRQIEKRHLLRLEYDYLKGKHDRFTMPEVKSGFKNSQKVDIGLISKLSRAFLTSVFPKVYSVKGAMVDQFRKSWGMHEFQRDEEGNFKLDVYENRMYAPKDRSNHTHHCQDAVVIACMSKQKYDVLAASWRSEEKDDKKKAKDILERSKPWETFTQDVKALRNEVLVVHHTPDNVGKNAKRIWRKRGIVQRNEKGEPIYLQGDVARGSLHKETFYGAILRPELDKKTGIPILDKSGEEKQKLNYVLRKELASIEDSGLKHIVDERIKAIVIAGRAREKVIQKEIAELTKQLKKAEEHEEEAIKNEIATLKLKIENELYLLPNKNGSPIPIKKVRCFQPTVTDPIHLKPHSHLSEHEHKQSYHVMNDGNHMVTIYEGIDKKGNMKRDFSIINMIQAADKTNILNPDRGALKLRSTLIKGNCVLFYQNHPDELKKLLSKQLYKRMYQLVKFDKSGRLYFRPHTEARPASDLQEQSSIDLNNPCEQIVMSRNNWNFIVIGQEFELSKSGKITFNF